MRPVLPKSTRPISNELYRVYAVFCGALGIVPFVILCLMGNTALKNLDRMHEYRDQAVSTTATVERFDTTTQQIGRESVTYDKIVIRYQDQGRTVIAPLKNHRTVVPEEKSGWIGREVKIVHLSGRPDSALMASDIDLLRGPSDMLQWMPAPALMLVLCGYMAMSLWRKGRSKG